MYRQITWDAAARRAGNSMFGGPGTEFLTIGGTPCDEDCTQAGENLRDGIVECHAYIDQLIRVHGTPPEGCEFFIVENHHEFGIYHEAAIFYAMPDEEAEDPDETALDYAMKVEGGCEKWDAQAKKFLRSANHHLHVHKLAIVVTPIRSIAK